MKKMISLVSAAVMTASLLLPQTLAFSAAAQEDGDALIDAAYSENALTATGTENTLPYQLRFVPERNFVTAEEVAAGDVVIPASVYITGSTANTFGSAMVKYNAYHNGEKTGDVYSRTSPPATTPTKIRRKRPITAVSARSPQTRFPTVSAR